MGQYYRPAMLIDGEIKVFNREVDGEIEMAKLTEHSWYENPMCEAIAEMMFQKKVRLVWCGDYAEGNLCSEFSSARKDEILTTKDIWNIHEEKELGLKSTDFRLRDYKELYLINHDQKIYVDLNKYYENSVGYCIYREKKEEWCTFPISLLTAQGNGLGGGDYWGINEEMVGSWCWDLISLDTEIPQDYKEIELCFRERSSFLTYEKEIY